MRIEFHTDNQNWIDENLIGVTATERKLTVVFYNPTKRFVMPPPLLAQLELTDANIHVTNNKNITTAYHTELTMTSIEKNLVKLCYDIKAKCDVNTLEEKVDA